MSPLLIRDDREERRLSVSNWSAEAALKFLLSYPHEWTALLLPRIPGYLSITNYNYTNETPHDSRVQSMTN
jgi:hypothetical protein